MSSDAMVRTHLITRIMAYQDTGMADGLSEAVQEVTAQTA
jgi:hypothetical protein